MPAGQRIGKVTTLLLLPGLLASFAAACLVFV